MNNFSPDQMYNVIEARHQDIRNVEAARQAAKLAQGDQSNPLQAIVKGIATFAQRINTPTTEVTPASDSIQLGNEQV